MVSWSFFGWAQVTNVLNFALATLATGKAVMVPTLPPPPQAKQWAELGPGYLGMLKDSDVQA